MQEYQIPEPVVLEGKSIVQGTAEGPVLGSTVALSFWGGVHPETGDIIDHHHPIARNCVAGKILAIPSSRGSCSGSGVLLELLLNGHSPAALVFERDELILTLGVIIASEFFQKSIPIIQLCSRNFAALLRAQHARIDGSCIQCRTASSHSDTLKRPLSPEVHALDATQEIPPNLTLSSFDLNALDGHLGKAAQVAARVIMKIAVIQGATELIDIKQAHIDGCVYTGPATLRFAQRLCLLGAKVCVPTTLNSISIDRRQWQAQGMDPALGDPAGKLADAYVEMGAQPTYTCAPYLLEDSVPKQGEQIMWAESNAVVYANSVLGAQTIKCPDYLDICAALTGRVPNTGCHIAANRKAQIQVALSSLVVPTSEDVDSLFPLLGYAVGDVAGSLIPVVTGLEYDVPVTRDDLKAFGAAFATTSSAPMFHIAGITPEALSSEDLETQLSASSSTKPVTITRNDLAAVWRQFNNTDTTRIDLISLGNPHFSCSEIAKLASLCQGRTKAADVAVMVTCGRHVYSKACKDGHIATLETFGVKIMTDTCWCMITDPVIPLKAETIMTNSAKYAHYGMGLTGRQMRFGSLMECFEAACCGQASSELPSWLDGSNLIEQRDEPSYT